MGKATGFLEFRRATPADNPPALRIESFAEFHNHMDVEKLRIQCARCMDCGVPFCHTGLAPDKGGIGCPLNNLIPEWNDLVYKGNIPEAYRRLSKTSNFPEFTGRVCPALCEGSCTAGLILEPVAIKNAEVHIIDYMYEHNLIKPYVPQTRTGKTVAVAGAGPAGLAAADTLNKLGHSVTVYERDDRVGGLLMYGIPNMKLDKKIIDRRVNLMKEEGVQFVTNTEITDLGELRGRFDAVVLSTGARKPRPLSVQGSDLSGVYYAVDFLKAATKSYLDSSAEHIDCSDKNVIVVGGGDTGTDCVATSIRLGARSVTQLEIMDKLPEKRNDRNPWPTFPRVLKTDYGQEEAITKFGGDPRVYLTTIEKITGTDGKVTHVHTTGVKFENGRFTPVGETTAREADIVLIAMGFVGAEDSIKGVPLSQRGVISTKKDAVNTVDTELAGVFAAGDARRGQSLVVWAIREGRDAAFACDKYLQN
ncbi:glutamate synthase subunit beta [Clostridia bacterium]|nr:glutamate synthase subunit beta [Clostridia bacterium]